MEHFVRTKDGSNATPNGDISVSVLKSTFDMFFPYIINITNLSIGREGVLLMNLSLHKFEKKR